MSSKELPPTIGRYDVLGRLGQGGMGVVYRGRDPRIGRPVAIKLLRMSDEGLRARFLQEAQSAGNLRHPNIVTIYDYGEHEEQPFIVMEYLEGVTLAEQIRLKAPLSLTRKLEFIETLSTALEYAHNRGIVHRDIKPANIMVDVEGVLKVLDFGIARVGDSGLTQVGVMIGTPNYMSPEQINGQVVDRRSDIFAVGLVAYELLSYQQAFSGDSLLAVMQAVLRAAPVPLGELCPDLHPALQAVVGRAIEKDQLRRYQTLGELTADLTIFKNRVWPSRSALSDQPTIRVPMPVPLPPADQPSGAPPRAQDRPPTIQAALGRARESLANGDVESAIRTASEILIQDPTNKEAHEITSQALGAAEQRRHREAAEAAVNEQKEAFAAGRHAEAIAALERFSPAHDAVNRALTEMRRAVADLERQAHQEEGRKQAQRRWVGRQLEFARASIDERQFADAIELLERVEQVNATATGLGDLLQEARAGLAAAETDARRRREIAEKLAGADEALAAERLDQAASLVAAVLALTPDHGGALAKQRDIEARVESRRQKDLLDRQAESASETARRRFEAGEHAAALAMLDKFTPAHPAVTRARTELRAKLAAIEQAARETRIVEERTEAEEEIRRGRFAQALERLQRLEKRDGPIPDLGALVARARAGQAAEEKRKEDERIRREAEAARLDREQWARAQFEQARSQLGRNEPRRAVRILEEVRKRLAGAEDAGPLLRDLASLSADVERRIKIQDLVVQAKKTLQKDPESARRIIDEALALDSTASEALELQAKIQAAIAERALRQATEQTATRTGSPVAEPGAEVAPAIDIATLAGPTPTSERRDGGRLKMAGAVAAAIALAAGGYAVWRNQAVGPTKVEESAAITTTIAPTTSPSSTSVPPEVTTTIPDVQPDVDQAVTAARTLLGRGNLSGAAKQVAEGLGRAPKDPALESLSAAVLDAAAARVTGVKGAATRANASDRPDYVEATKRELSAVGLRRAGSFQSAVEEYVTAARLFTQAARQGPLVAAVTSVVPTSIPVGRQSAPVTTTVPPTRGAPTTTIPVPSIDLATVQELLTRYAAASRSFNVGAVQQVYPSLPNRTKARIDALKKNFNYCDYRFTNVQIVSSTGTEAVVRTDSVESCKPKTGQKAFDAPGRQEFHFSKDPGGAWLVSEIFISQ